MTVDEAKSCIDEISRRFNAGDAKVYDDFWSQRYVGHEAGKDFSLEEVKKSHAADRKSFSNLSVKCTVLFVSGDMIAFRYAFSGTHDGIFMGKPATGKHFEAWGVDVFRMEGGKIVEEWAAFDDLGKLQQLGVVPKLG
jgi:predicted ester cyclase